MLLITALHLGILACAMLASDPLRRDQHEIANKVHLRKRLLCGGNLAKWPDRGKQRPYFVVLDLPVRFGKTGSSHAVVAISEISFRYIPRKSRKLIGPAMATDLGVAPATPLGQLQRDRLHSTRYAGHKNLVAISKTRIMQHSLGRGIGTGNGRQLSVGSHAGTNKDTSAEERVFTTRTIGLYTAKAVGLLDGVERVRLVPSAIGLLLRIIPLSGE